MSNSMPEKGRRALQEPPGEIQAVFLPLAVLAALVGIGTALQVLDLISWPAVLEWMRGFTPGWGMALAIILAQGAMFTFALPGSVLVWVAAVLYSPSAATAILTAGSTLGALGAYQFALRITRAYAEQAAQGKMYIFLRAQGDFFTLCAMRVLPGFPHSLINYTSGTLRLPLSRFLGAAALGLAFKTFLYSSAISELIESAERLDIMRAETLAPLFLIALLLLLGRIAQKRWFRKEPEEE